MSEKNVEGLPVEALMEKFKELPITVKEENSDSFDNKVDIFNDDNGKRWACVNYFKDKYKLSPPTIRNILNNSNIETVTADMVKKSTIKNIKRDIIFFDFFKSELALQKYLESLPKDGSEIAIINGEQRVPASFFYTHYDITKMELKRFIEDKNFVTGKHPVTKRDTNLYLIQDVVDKEFLEYVKMPQVITINGKYTDADEREWVTLRFLVNEYNVSYDTVSSVINKAKNIRKLTVRIPGVHKIDLINLADVRTISESGGSNPFKRDIPDVDNSGVYKMDGIEYVPLSFFIDQYDIAFKTIKKRTKTVPNILARGRNKKEVVLFRKDKAVEILEKYKDLPQTDEYNIYIENGKKYAPRYYFVKTMGINYEDLNKCLVNLRAIHGKNKNNKEVDLYSIDEVESNSMVNDYVDKNIIKEQKGIAKAKEKSLSYDLKFFITEVVEGKTLTAQEFQALIRAIGSSHCLNILYKFHPEFKDLPIEHVKGIIAEYLGDFLVVKTEFRLSDVKVVASYLSDSSLRDVVFEKIKKDGLSFYFRRRKAGEKENLKIVSAYLDELVEAIQGLENIEILDDIVQDVVLYYDSIFKDFQKPESFVDTLTPGREFPDINQRVNMKELADKKRLLIADEMGLGKSASVIMAKEQLGVKSALVVAPSNVVSTWQRYLSDDQKKGGYYKPGQAPSVLTIENPMDIEKIFDKKYDFILISQEKMNEKYVEALKQMDFGMLIVDEVHKMKSLTGMRTNQLSRLVENINGDEKYLALLSGTPVPNKIEDVVIILKLLYPDKFGNIENREVVQQIIQGGIYKLRDLLMPHMQLKNLKEGVEMPALEEAIISIKLSKTEKEVYEVLLEDDEMNPTEKIKILRQFLLNPKSIDSTPGIESAKIEKTKNLLDEVFRENNKVVLFVNGYIENVIRGDNSFVDNLHLPTDVKVRIIHGDILHKDRELMQKEFNISKDKILLIVSGQTADVGVDYSGADQVFFYNEPWTEYQRRQELSRIYRPGLAHSLKSGILLSEGTIEEGIHEYIQRKYLAVEKLLHDIPLTDMEKELLAKDEKGKEDPDLSVNPELAKYYFSSWDKMMKMFGYSREIGEKSFSEFLSKYGRDYAESYVDLGNRSYQANANRISGTIIHELTEEKGEDPKSLAIIDLASGPEMLKQHIGNEYQEQITSIDLNEEHFANRDRAKTIKGSISDIPFPPESFDFVNLCLSFHYTSFSPSHGDLERLKVLMEMNRVLKPGGKALINLVYNIELKNYDKFKRVIKDLGFRIEEKYTGEIVVKDQYRSTLITLQKVEDAGGFSIDEIAEIVGIEDLGGLKFTRANRSLKNSRQIVTDFELKGRNLPINFNNDDKEVYEEEQSLLQQGNELKNRFRSIENIPAQNIIEKDFVRIKAGKKYILFKKLTKGSGVVLIK